MCDEACDIRKSLAYLAGFDEGFAAGTKAERPNDLGPPIREGHDAATTHVGFIEGCPYCA